jgi:hypothetical protein
VMYEASMPSCHTLFRGRAGACAVKVGVSCAMKERSFSQDGKLRIA